MLSSILNHFTRLSLPKRQPLEKMGRKQLWRLSLSPRRQPNKHFPKACSIVGNMLALKLDRL